MKRFEIVDFKRLYSFLWIVLGHIAVLYLLFTAQWQLLFLSWLVFLPIIHLGISLTYHRIIAHGSAKIPPWLENIGIFLAGLSFQGSPISWGSVHRQHHAQHGTPLDPHGTKLLKSWYVQTFSYTFCRVQNKYILGLTKNKTYMFWHKYYYWIYLPIVILPFFFMPFNLVVALFWAPIGITYQFESMVNTLAHTWDKDIPRNTLKAAFFIGGEAYHENHHSYPARALFGKYDIIGHFLLFLEKQFSKGKK